MKWILGFGALLLALFAGCQVAGVDVVGATPNGGAVGELSRLLGPWGGLLVVLASVARSVLARLDRFLDLQEQRNKTSAQAIELGNQLVRVGQQFNGQLVRLFANGQFTESAASGAEVPNPFEPVTLHPP
jgi:parvulin-like peptidyl-prolyl isomerase